MFQVTNGKVFERIVRLGEERDGMVALLAGAKKGDRLVAAPDEKTRDGVTVVE